MTSRDERITRVRRVLSRHSAATRLSPSVAKSSQVRCIRLPTEGCTPPAQWMQLAAEEGAVAVLDVHDLTAVGRAETERLQVHAGVVEAVHVGGRMRAVGVGERPGGRAEHGVGAEIDQRPPRGKSGYAASSRSLACGARRAK